jgi:hypothetical protein
MSRAAFAVAIVLVFCAFALNDAKAVTPIFPSWCPTPNCTPWTIPFLGDPNNLESRYAGAIQSRSDPRLSSTGSQTDCVKYDLTDARPAARNCDLLPTKDRRVP